MPSDHVPPHHQRQLRVILHRLNTTTIPHPSISRRPIIKPLRVILDRMDFTVTSTADNTSSTTFLPAANPPHTPSSATPSLSSRTHRHTIAVTVFDHRQHPKPSVAAESENEFLASQHILTANSSSISVPKISQLLPPLPPPPPRPVPLPYHKEAPQLHSFPHLRTSPSKTSRHPPRNDLP